MKIGNSNSGFLNFKKISKVNSHMQNLTQEVNDGGSSSDKMLSAALTSQAKALLSLSHKQPLDSKTPGPKVSKPNGNLFDNENYLKHFSRVVIVIANRTQKEIINALREALDNVLSKTDSITDDDIKSLNPIINVTKYLNFDEKTTREIHGITLNVPTQQDNYNKQLNLTESVFRAYIGYGVKDDDATFSINMSKLLNNKFALSDKLNIWDETDRVFKNILELNGLESNIKKINIDFTQGSAFNKLLACVKATKDLIYPRDYLYLQSIEEKLRGDNLFNKSESQIFNLGVCRNDAYLVQHLLKPLDEKGVLKTYHIIGSTNHEYNVLYDVDKNKFYKFDIFSSDEDDYFPKGSGLEPIRENSYLENTIKSLIEDKDLLGNQLHTQYIDLRKFSSSKKQA